MFSDLVLKQFSKSQHFIPLFSILDQNLKKQFF